MISSTTTFSMIVNDKDFYDNNDNNDFHVNNNDVHDYKNDNDFQVNNNDYFFL